MPLDRDPPSPAGSPEDLFAEFLERIEAGEQADFEDLCREHAAAAPALRRMHVRWLAMTQAFGELSREPAGGRAGATSSEALDELMQKIGARGGRISRYAIGPEIARGAMGRIVQAWDTDLRREVALKFHRGGRDDGRGRRRFLEEAQIAAQLDHPGIVPIHELGLDAEGRPFFSMRLVRGRDLGEILALERAGEGGWTRTSVLHVLLRACEAMAFAHDRGVVHRDLKPANIMVGRFGEAYVMDWGLARVRASPAATAPEVASPQAPAQRPADAEAPGQFATLRADIASEDAEGSSPLLTQKGDVLGTPSYMAPEQAQGAGRGAEPAVDVYATGAILYHLLAGHAPYLEARETSASDVLRRLLAGPPPLLDADTPAELRAICERAMARDPAQRYADMGALAADLRAFLEVRTVRAYATGRFAELRKWIARNRALAASCLGLLLVLTAASVAVTLLWMRAEGNRVRADSGAARLQTELDRSAFRSARQSLQLDDSSEAGDALWRAHLAGRTPRATAWALVELAERDPYLVTLPMRSQTGPVAFGRRIDAVLLGGTDGHVHVHDAATLQWRQRLGSPGPTIASLAAAADSAKALAGNTRGELIVFDLVAQREERRVQAHTGSLRQIGVTADGGFATGGADGRVLWWSTHSAEPRLVLEFSAGVTSLAVTPEGDGVVAGDDQGTLRGTAFDGSWGLQLAIGARATALAFGSTRNQVWAGSTDHLLRFFDLTDPRQNRVQPTRNGTCRQLARAGDGSMLAGGWWRTDRFGPDGSALPSAALRGISRFAFDPDRQLLATTGTMFGLGVVDVSTRDRRRLPGTSVALSADGHRLATIAGQRAVVRDVDGDTLVGQVEVEGAGWVRLDPTGRLLAVTTRQPHQVKVFEAATGVLRFTTAGPAEVPFGDSCCFSPDGQEIAVCSGDVHVRRLRCRDGEVLGEHSFAGGNLIRLVYAHDGGSLAVLGRDKPVVRVFRLADGSHRDVPFDPILPTGTQTTLSALALSPDGARIAVGTWQGEILVREPDGRTTKIPAHAGTIWSLQFPADDPGLLISSGGSFGISFWDLDTNECCYRTLHDVAGQVQVSHDGRTLACLVPDGVTLLDLAYRERHVAGNLAYQLARQADRVTIPPARERELREWAAKVLARPWPRWL